MTNTETTTTKTNHHFKALITFAILSLVAILLLTQAQKPAHATATFTVTNTNDSGAGSLRQAILDANNTTDADSIRFAISGSGVQTIQPLTPLPPITRPVSIDGYTQSGTAPNTLTVGDNAILKIRLDGLKLSDSSRGLDISNSDGSAIRGLIIDRFGTGVAIHGDSVANHVEGNFIGTDPSGTLDQGNHFHGVDLFSGPSENVVGGPTPGARNVISGNDGDGISVFGANLNQIEGNYVGTDKGGTKKLGNRLAGVGIDGTFQTTLFRNVISGNQDHGLLIKDSQSTFASANRVGTTAGSIAPLGNASSGLFIAGSSGSVIGSEQPNTIAFNGLDGIAVAGGTGNDIVSNSVFSNGGLAIDLLGPGESAATDISTRNDAGDPDVGPNNLQNKPVLTSARTVSGKTTITGKLNSTPNGTFFVQFFSNPSGNEGKKLIGIKSVNTGPDGTTGTFTFSPAASVAVGQTITAAVLDGTTKDTSELSAPRTVASS